jgi:hypothetical protein
MPEAQSVDQPLRKSAQRLRWFVDAFERQVTNTESQTGNSFMIDGGILAQVFGEWLKAFEAQKPTRDQDKPAYVGFAAGLMLRTLIKHKPVSLVHRPDGADDSNPAYFWPEGYLHVCFCLNVRGLVLETDYHSEQRPSDALNETRIWWSFRENVHEDPSLAIAFLDLFAGDEPEWTIPELFRTGRVHEIADRFYTKDVITSDDAKGA